MEIQEGFEAPFGNSIPTDCSLHNQRTPTPYRHPVMPVKTALLHSLNAFFNSTPEIWPIAGFFSGLVGRKPNVPRLHSEVYSGVSAVRDKLLPDGLIIRILVMKAKKNASAKILAHEHDHISEEFEVIRCDCPEQSFVLVEDPKRRGSLIKIPLHVGKTFRAVPNEIHGIKVKKGTLVMRIRVRNFDREDIRIFAPQSAPAAKAA